jgi:hypothetical protein
MAIGTYSELQSALASWSVRDDLTAQIPNFIALFEARINRTLRVRQMETIATLVPASGVATVPADYLEWKSLTYLGTVYNDLQFVNPSVFTEMYPDNPTDIPTIWTLVGDSIKLMPIDTANTNLRLQYYAKIAALSVSNTTNWLLTNYPDVYLFGSMVELSAYVMEPDGAQMWKARADEVMTEILRLDSFQRAPSAIRPIGIPTP